MLLSQRPLTASPVEQALVTRATAVAADAIAKAARRGLNVLLLGERGSGRTTLLSAVQRRLVDDGAWADVHRIDCEPCQDVAGLLRTLTSVLGAADNAAPQPRWQDHVGAPSSELDVAAVVGAATHRVELAECDGSTSGRLAVLLDNLQPDPAHDLFGRFRDTIWQAPVVWIAAADASRDGYLAPPADSFWERQVPIGPLRPDDAADLLGRRVAGADPGDPDAVTLAGAIDRLVTQLRDPSPRDVLRAANALLDADTATDEGQGAAQPRAVPDPEVGGRRARALLYELDTLGRPAHAGDAQLMRRLGLSRPRIATLFNELERAGLVERFHQGRRVLYRSAPTLPGR